jgi:hypothetical protein
MARSLVPPSLASGVSMSEILRCQRCEDVIGVYEPMVVIVDGQPRETSRAADDTTRAPTGVCYHRSCFARAQGEAP